MRRSNEDLRRMIALGPKALSTNVLGYDLARELLALRELERAGHDLRDCHSCASVPSKGEWQCGCDCTPCTTMRAYDDARAKLDALGEVE